MKTDRLIEKKILKTEINKMLEEMGVSKRLFKKTLPKMSKSGYEYKINPNGGKPSLRQQYQFLKELKESLDDKKIGIDYKENENEK